MGKPTDKMRARPPLTEEEQEARRLLIAETLRTGNFKKRNDAKYCNFVFHDPDAGQK